MMRSRCISPGERIRFGYVNHRNEYANREVIFLCLDFGSNEWYPEPQWFLRCYDPTRKAERSFALAKIDGGRIMHREPPRHLNPFERFIGAGSELHHQVYWAWRVYRQGMIHTSLVFLMLGFVLGTLLQFVLNGIANG